MEFQGKMIQFLGETGGTSKTGKPWKKKEWLLETFGQYPRKVKVQCFNERSDSIIMEPGRDYSLQVDLESREFNGRWYTDVTVYRVDEYQYQPSNPMNQTQQPSQFQPQTSQNYPGDMGSSANFTPLDNDQSDEDLPF